MSTSCSIGFSKNLNRLGTTYGSLVLDNQATGLNACGNLNITLPASPTAGQTITVNNVCGGKVVIPAVPMLNQITPIIGGTAISSTSSSTVCISQDGLHVYISSNTGINMYSRNVITGALTSIGNLATQLVGYDISISDNGLFVYQASSVPGIQLRTFSRNVITGILTQISILNSVGGFSRFSVSAYKYGWIVTNSASGVNSASVNLTSGIPSASGILNIGQCDVISGAILPNISVFYVRYLASGNIGIKVISLNLTNGTVSDNPLLFVQLSTISYLKVSPTKKFLYVTQTSLPYLILYSINQITGALTFVKQISIFAAAWEITFSASGSVAYVSHGSAISIYSVNNTTGDITWNSTINGLTGGIAMVASKDGLDLYCAAQNSTVYCIRLANIVNKTITLFKSAYFQTDGITWTVTPPVNQQGFLNFSIG